MQVAYWGREIKLEELQWSEHQANPGDGMALQGRRELRQVGGAFVLLHRPVADWGGPGRGRSRQRKPLKRRAVLTQWLISELSACDTHSQRLRESEPWSSRESHSPYAGGRVPHP